MQSIPTMPRSPKNRRSSEPAEITCSSLIENPWLRITVMRLAFNLEASFVASTHGLPASDNRSVSSIAPGNGSMPSTNTPYESNAIAS